MTPTLGKHAISELNGVALPRLRFDNEMVLLLTACRYPKSDRLLEEAISTQRRKVRKESQSLNAKMKITNPVKIVSR